MLPCTVIDLFLNNQQDALIIQIYCYKIVHVSGILSAHHQEFSAVHSTLVNFVQVLMMYSRKLLMMGTEDARNM